MSSPSSEIYFYHIPKTAGTSLAGMIRRAFPPEQCVPAFSANDLLQMPPEQISRYRCYTGHFFSLLDHYVERTLPTVTLLRDPFEQTVSMLEHAKRETALRGIGRWIFRRIFSTWDAVPFSRSFIEARMCPYLMNNYQTRSLGADLSALAGGGERKYRYAVDEYLKTNDIEQCFERAVARLNAMAVVGTVERFRESAGLIFDMLGVPLPQNMSHENVSKKKRPSMSYRASGDISKDFAQLIDAQNVYDERLYKLACERLTADLAAKRQGASAPQTEGF